MMACEYCDSTEELFNKQNLVMFLDGNRSMQADVLYDPDNYLWESFVVSINFCPMCGHDLRGDAS